MKRKSVWMAYLCALVCLASWVLALPVLAEETPAETTMEEEMVAEEATETEKEEKEEKKFEKPESERNETAYEKPVILLVSFGTSYNENRALTIDALEKSYEEAFPDYEIRRAFTSQIIIDKLKKRDHLEIDNVGEAMTRLVEDGVRDVIIQPTHVMAGFEYDDVVAETSLYKEYFDTFKIGSQLLRSQKDFDELVEILVEEHKATIEDPETALVFMGHGTEHPANITYTKMQEAWEEYNYPNVVVGTVESTPSLEDVLERVKGLEGVKKVVLAPMMIVAGDHANNDMAGDEEDTWKTAFTNAGYEVECHIHGLAEIEDLRKFMIEHTKKTISLNPLTAEQIKPGTYPVSVESSASMFKVTDCQVTVEDCKMMATLTLSGKGYGKLFMGTGAVAEQLSEEEQKEQFAEVEMKDDKATYTVEIPALDQEVDCAAWSLKKEKWYDRVLVFKAEDIPEEAIVK